MSRSLLCLALAVLSACGGQSINDVSQQNFTSDEATLLVFDFDGELVTAIPSPTSSLTPSLLKGQIKAQMLYMVGQLNDVRSVARLDKLQLSNVTATAAGAGLTRIRYHAKLPVAYGSVTNPPASFPVVLPHRIDAAGQASFFNAYSAGCNDLEGAQMSVSNYWYHWRPHASGCTIAAADVVSVTASAAVSTLNTKGKYPEYHRVWEDGALDVLAVFGKYAKGATDGSDAGIAAYNQFVAAVLAQLPGASVTPATLSGVPGAATPEVVVRATLPDGKIVTVSALLVDEVQSATPAWIRRYGELSTGADLIVYNGHAGLGANVAALARMGNFFPGKYQIVFFDGCDSFAYADDTLATRRAALNPDDPSGTKYMDVVANAMPAYFANMPDATMAMIRALLHPEAPATYSRIFNEISPDHVVVVSGEEDNAFGPSTRLAPIWSAPTETAFVAKSESVLYTTDLLPAGTYAFQMTADQPFAGGDADLRLRPGAAPPLTAQFKCKSYLGNSNEKCILKLTAPAKVFLTVTGDAAGVESHFVLKGFSL